MNKDDSGKWRDAALAAVVVSGKLGYPGLTVSNILEAGGLSRESFYELFSDEAECYAAGYALAMEELRQALLEACESEADLPRKLIAGLNALLWKITAEPELVRGLLVEIHLAGRVALQKRDEFARQFEEVVSRLEGEGQIHRP